MKEYFIDKDGFKLHAKLELPKEHPQELPIVILVHGLTGDMEEEHIVAAKDAMLSIGYAVLRVEMYGHGMSDGLFMNHTIIEWVDELLYVIDHVRTFDFVTDIYLMGHSQGGYTVMIAAALKADQIKGLVPLSPATSIPELCRKGDMLGVGFDSGHIPDTIELKPNYILGSNYIRTARVLPVDKVIRAYHGPVLLIHGTGDDTIPHSCSEHAAALYDQADLVLIPDDGHCYELHLDMVKTAITSWFKSL